MVGHQETCTEWADDLHLVAYLQIAHVVGRNASHRIALVVFKHALDGKRQVVVARPLAIAGARNRILAGMVWAPICIRTWRDDANGLTLQHRKGHVAEIQHDVMRVVFPANGGDAHITHHRGGDGFFCRFGAIEIGIGVGSRPWRQQGAVLGAVEDRVPGSRVWVVACGAGLAGVAAPASAS